MLYSVRIFGTDEPVRVETASEQAAAEMVRRQGHTVVEVEAVRSIVTGDASGSEDRDALLHEVRALRSAVMMLAAQSRWHDNRKAVYKTVRNAACSAVLANLGLFIVLWLLWVAIVRPVIVAVFVEMNRGY